MNNFCSQCKYWTLDHQGSSDMIPDGWGTCTETGWRQSPTRSACNRFQNQATLADVCFSCQHFQSAPTPEKLSHGVCVYGETDYWYDGLTNYKCANYIPKFGNYPKRIRVVRFRNQEKKP